MVEGFIAFAQKMELEKLIPVIREGVRRFEESEYPRIIAQVCAAADAAVKSAAGAFAEPGGQGEPSTPAADSSTGSSKDKPQGQAGDAQEPSQPQPAPKVEIISIRSARVPFDKPLLTSEADVDTYLDSMRKTLLEEIRKGKRIQI